MRMKMRKTVSMTVLMEAKAFSQRTPMRGVRMASITMQMAWWIAVTASVRPWRSAVEIPLVEEIRWYGDGNPPPDGGGNGP